VLATHGYLDEALAWAGAHDVSTDDDLSYLHEFEHVTLARVLLARHTADGDGDSLRKATSLLQRLLVAAEAGGRTGTVIEVLVLQALAQHVDGDTAGGLVPLGRALSLAKPEGYVRVFAGEGRPMAVLLRAAGARVGETAYVHRLVAACSGTAQESAPGTPSAGRGGRRRQGLVEQLSDRELEVLRLLSTDLAGPGIARHLMVSLSTVRTHTQRIYAKLGVNSRRAAVRRAEELGLLSRTVHH
jgi:LuxR family transcriptional regulator, maltose regulon positive regulatory protein